MVYQQEKWLSFYLSKNQFIQYKYEHDGLYGVVGFERRYVGGNVDKSKPIYDIGLGYKQEKYDFSLEWIHLDKAFVDTLNDEQYLIAEIAYHSSPSSSLMLGWSSATELDVSTIRLSYTYQIEDDLEFHIAYAVDDGVENDDGDDKVNSLDLRLTYSF